MAASCTVTEKTVSVKSGPRGRGIPQKMENGYEYTYRIYCNKAGDYNIFVALRSIVDDQKGDQVDEVVRYNTVTGVFEMGSTTVDQQTIRDLEAKEDVTINILKGAGYNAEADVTETVNAALEASAAAAEAENKANEELTAAQEAFAAAQETAQTAEAEAAEQALEEAQEQQAAAEEALDDAAQAAQTAQEAVDAAREEAQEAHEEVSDAQEALETAEQDLADANEALETL